MISNKFGLETVFSYIKLQFILVGALAVNRMLDFALELIHDPGFLLKATLSQLNAAFWVQITTAT
jgi:hypothetical protein